MTSSTSWIISGSSAEVGSSNSMILGCMLSARAMATRCCCPPDSCAGYWSGLLAQADPLEVLERGFGRLVLRDAADDDRGKADVLEHGLVRVEIEPLEHHRDLLPDLGDRRAVRHEVDAVDDHLTAGRPLEHVDAADQCRLARARRADDDELLAGRDLEVDVLEGVMQPEPLAHADELDQDRSSAGAARLRARPLFPRRALSLSECMAGGPETACPGVPVRVSRPSVRR